MKAFEDSNGRTVGPMRVWKSCLEVPGLAMSRSFGDDIAHQVGVISVPEVMLHQRSYADKAIVICSDGLTEFISNSYILKVLQPYFATGDCESASKALLQEAIGHW